MGPYNGSTTKDALFDAMTRTKWLSQTAHDANNKWDATQLCTFDFPSKCQHEQQH